MAIKLNQVKDIGNHPALAMPLNAYARRRYRTPFFIFRETLSAFQLHNGFSISASLSFYAMFALIPMALLIFFMLSHLVVSSNYAIVKLAILTSNLVPKFSHRIMIEVYNVSKHQAVWGAFGMFALFWIVTPLAGALRSAFHTIASMVEEPSFIKRKIKDVFGVLGILLLFFIFTLMGLGLEKVIDFVNPSARHTQLIDTLSSIAICTVLIAIFYRIFFPARISLKNILIGSAITGIMWIAMRPAFGLFLSLNQSYDTVFGGMKNMFISIGWLYYTFAVFLLGTELISTLHKKDVLLLRGLFGELPKDKEHYLQELMNRYGKIYQRDEYVFRQGEHGLDLYYIVMGKVQLIFPGGTIREIGPGDYFGEMALLTDSPRVADAKVITDHADIVIISADNIETLLMGEPKVAMRFLKHMARRLQHSNHTL
ncbi:YhjD/YihY/BrkB family envelope integrity protein [Methylovorus mays]|uniref:YhjD/YihY/BrkB family envelope integrity protein n=1 Tax=Methylovorus mays TaxID=184077 RepID=UPI001E3BB5AB|nr:YhjD/YihY/BrkB family envelope integrity protein [Methylovorus mays]MCB5207890.1 YihY family inner membrane protein [Methylovorus mays]